MNPEESFNLFWQAYPRKVARKVARAVWGRLKPDEELIQIILQALEQHKKTEQWVKDGGIYIPHASTWLNQERWTDELQIEGQGSTKYKDI